MNQNVTSHGYLETLKNPVICMNRNNSQKGPDFDKWTFFSVRKPAAKSLKTVI